MGRRAALFYSARDCVNALNCAKPNDEMYDKNFGLCMTLCTRQKLIKCAHEIITDIYKKNFYDPKKLRRFYKLNTLHMFQLEKLNTLHMSQLEKYKANTFVSQVFGNQKLDCANVRNA